MDLARTRTHITVASVVTILSAIAVAAPPSSEMNGVARISSTSEETPPEIASPGTIVEPALVPAVDRPEAAVEVEGSAVEVVSDSASAGEPDAMVIETGLPIDDPEEASRAAAASVLSTAGEIASFDRTPIFGTAADGEAVNEPTTTTATAGAGEADRWWNAPELRVFGLLAVLVLAAVFMKRHGGRGIGLAGGPRPSGVVSVLGRFPFGRSASLVLLECGPKVLLLHQHAGKGGEVTTLAEFGDRDEVADLRGRLSANERDEKGGFGRELEQTLGLYDRKGRPRGFKAEDGLPVQGPIETVDLTRRRPRRGVRGL